MFKALIFNLKSIKNAVEAGKYWKGKVGKVFSR
jgi:hypothetical protein